MKLFLLSAVALLGVAQVYGQNTNPCAGVPGTNQFRNDWSSCSAYFWCNNGEAVHTVPCAAGLGFDEVLQECTPAAATCPSCPPSKDISVADPSDADCRQYNYCRGGVRGTTLMICGDNLRFNRVTGLCDPANTLECWVNYAPTNPPTGGTTVPPGGTTTSAGVTTVPPGGTTISTGVTTVPPGGTTTSTVVTTLPPGGTNAPPSINFCDANLCPPGVSHIGCGHTRQFDPSCPADSTLLTFSAAHIQAVLNSHNTYRNRIASGGVPGFQPARRMATMTWSVDLAFLAELNVKQCKMNHEPCRNTPDFSAAGQNLAWWGGVLDINALIELGVDMWWNEVNLATQADIDRCCDNYMTVGHFTQLVSDRSIQVGCAISTYGANSLMACNYAFINMVGQSVYASGPAASGCTTGTNPALTSLCSVTEPIRPV